VALADVLDGIEDRLETISGLTVLIGAPTSVHALPAIYTILDGITWEQYGRTLAPRYRLLHRVVVRWQDNAQAEVELAEFANSIKAAIEADHHLDGLLGDSAGVEIRNADADWIEIGGTLYRCLDIYSEILDMTE
jgi:hypothetical protein